MDVEELFEEMKRPLSAYELLKIAPGAVVVTYDELHKARDIDELLGPDDKMFLLYLTDTNFGHWCCLFVNGKNHDTLNFFDSYGGHPDNLNIIDHIPNNILTIKHEDKSYLSNLMINSKYKNLNFNPYRLQGPSTSTCGRFCALRMGYDKLSDKKFDELVNGTFYTPDAYVTVITQKYLDNHSSDYSDSDDD